ncbi:MAG: ATP-binding cassette domain-containing protein [Proteobacteria bacterium]|nr:ATP-binding cassette domain-containing protein [Ramlibacter sp.]MCA0214947.1 ATP-binding cassette domain-containing protein [Pseudomonadota bacterium]
MIRTQGLRYQYPKGPQLAFADVDVPQGATLVLRGNSGSGKSTWLALVAGLLTATAGALTVADAQPGALAQAARDAWRARTLGFLPQKLHLSDALTVAQNLNLVYFAAGLPVDAAAVAQALAALDVADLAARKPSQLSGGQAQRVALARAVLLRPRVILADEPTASLDDASAAAALQLLAGSARQCGATLVIATHDRRVGETLAGAMEYRMGAA